MFLIYVCYTLSYIHTDDLLEGVIDEVLSAYTEQACVPEDLSIGHAIVMKGRKFLDAAVYIDALESPTASTTNGDATTGGGDGSSTSYMNRFKSAMRSSSSGGGKGTSQHSISSTFFGLRSNSPNRSARPEPVYVKKSLAVLLVQDPTLFVLVKSVSVLEYEVLVSLPFYLVGKFSY